MDEQSGAKVAATADAVTPMEGVAEETETPLAFRAVRGAIWVAAGSYFNLGFGFLAGLLLTRMLAPEHFGVFSLAGFFFSLANLRTKMGIGYPFAQRKETTGELIGTLLALDVAAGLLTVAIVGIATPVLVAFGYSWDVVWVMLAMGALGISDSIMATAWTLLDKNLRFGGSSLIATVVFPVSYAPAFWLATHDGGYWSLVAQSATYTLLLLGGMWWAARRWVPSVWKLQWRFDRATAAYLLRFGSIIGVGSMAAMLIFQFDNFLVGTFVGLATLGYYDRAYRIAEWPFKLVGNILTRIAYYTYARLQDDPVRLTKTVAMTSWVIAVVALPFALAIFVTAPDLVALLYGDRWAPSALFVRFLVVFSLVRPMLDLAASLFVAMDRPKRSTMISIVQLATLVACATPLTLLYGAVGTCVGVGISFAVGLVLAYAQVRRLLSFSVRSELVVPGLAAAIAAAAYFGINQSFDLNAFPLVLRVIGKAIGSVGIFFAIMFVANPARLVERVAYVGQLAAGRTRS